MFALEFPGEGFQDLEEENTRKIHDCHIAELRADHAQ